MNPRYDGTAKTKAAKLGQLGRGGNYVAVKKFLKEAIKQSL